jgi:hypothetical protein
MKSENFKAGAVFFLICIFSLPVGSLAAHARKSGKPDRPVLWENPADLVSRDLFYGSGGRKNVPTGPFTFLKEDLQGTNPKFDVVDSAGVHWKVKLGVEARPEVVASRIVWAAGFS